MHLKIVVMHTFALMLGKLLEVGASDLCGVPWLITCQKFILDGIPIVSGNAGILERIPLNGCSVAEDQVDLRKLASVVPICDMSVGFNLINKQSCGDHVFAFDQRTKASPLTCRDDRAPVGQQPWLAVGRPLSFSFFQRHGVTVR